MSLDASASPRSGDAAGEATLALFRENDAYTEFLWRRLSAVSPRPVEGRILEVGCGIGNLTRILLRSTRVEAIQAIDMEAAYVERIRAEIRDPRLQATVARAEEYSPDEHTTAPGGFDFIVSSNVLEHIEDDARALLGLGRMLRPSGVMLILVPAHPCLYSSLDRHLSHYRRYCRKDFRDLAARTSLSILRMRHFNPLGVMGWWLNGKILRRSILPSTQLGLYSRLAIPFSDLLDRVNPLPLGVSLLVALGRAETTTRATAPETGK